MMMMVLVRACAVVVCVMLAAIETGGQCRFPSRWHGSWFQSMLGEVHITHNAISRKGVCTGTHRNYYLLENRENQCFQCLLLVERHSNILQYQEGYCQESGSLSDICALIKEDAILWTFVREPSTPEPCPFQDAYHFQYNNQSGGPCTEPMSYVEPCAGEANLQLRFRSCEGAAYTYDQVLQLQCLAVWTDQFDGVDTKYMYGRLEGPNIVEKARAYRCFMVQTLGTVVYLAMSADSTCRGIRSPRDGPLTIELTKDVFGWPESMCTIPRWMSHTETWQDLSSRHRYSFAQQNHVIHMSYLRHSGKVGQVKSTYRCIEMLNHNHTRSEFTAVTYTSHHCKTRYQCLKVSQIHHNILQITTGHFTDFAEDACQHRAMRNPKSSVILPEPLTSRECPLTGHYFISLEGEGTGCSVELHSGCTRPDVIDIVSSCSSQPVSRLECVDSWMVQDQHYLIARRTGEQHGTLNCFRFLFTGDTIEFATDPACNIGVDHLYMEPIYYLLDAQPGSCSDLLQVDMTTRHGGGEGGGGGGGGGGHNTSPEQHLQPASTLEGKNRRHQGMYKVIPSKNYTDDDIYRGQQLYYGDSASTLLHCNTCAAVVLSTILSVCALIVR